MSVADKIRQLYGIECFLRKFDIPVNIGKDKHINQIFLDFAKETGWLNDFANKINLIIKVLTNHLGIMLH